MINISPENTNLALNQNAADGGFKVTSTRGSKLQKIQRKSSLFSPDYKRFDQIGGEISRFNLNL